MRIFHFIVIFILLGINSTLAQSNNDVLMTVGDSDVTVEEFKYIYEKNNGEKADYSKKSLDEYLELYKNFKLKVQKARVLKLDTIKTLKEELAGYRKQLASSFLSDKEVIGSVIDEIHARKKEDVEVEHILLKVRSSASNEKKKEVEEKIHDLKKQIAMGKTIGELAARHSQDKNSARQSGYLGFTTAMLPNGFYELENAIYESKVGDIVGPVWSKMGCHLLSVKSRRPARGVIKVAHILIKPEKNAPKSEKRAQEKADSIYNALNEGLSWKKAVTQYSDDRKTKKKNGELPIFGISTYERSFENVAFGLNNVGDISKPVQTKSGFHIVKLIERVPFESKEDIKKRLKDKIKNYDRYEKAEENLILKIKSRSNVKENKNILESYAKTLTSSFYSYKWNPGSAPDGILLSIDDKDISVQDFANYCKANSRKRRQFDNDKPILESINVMYDEFVRETAIDLEEKTLEDKYPAFRSLMREYQEGILLFEATKLLVWDKANQDSVGLKKFYEQNKEKYKYDTRANIGTYTINTTDEKQLNKIVKCAKKHNSEKTLKRFNKNGNELISYSETIEELNSDTFQNGLAPTKNSMTSPKIDTKAGVSTFSKVVSLEEARIKKLSEARGYVVADYQDQLEKDWLKKLAIEFDVKLNKKVYNSLIK